MRRTYATNRIEDPTKNQNANKNTEWQEMHHAATKTRMADRFDRKRRKCIDAKLSHEEKEEIDGEKLKRMLSPLFESKEDEENKEREEEEIAPRKEEIPLDCECHTLLRHKRESGNLRRIAKRKTMHNLKQCPRDN